MPLQGHPVELDRNQFSVWLQEGFLDLKIILFSAYKT